RPRIRDKVDEGPIGLMPDRGNQRDRAFRRRADDSLLIEAPEIFEAAPAARNNEQIGPRHWPRSGEGVEAADCRCHLRGASFALYGHRPEDRMRWAALVKAMQHVADDRARR